VRTAGDSRQAIAPIRDLIGRVDGNLSILTPMTQADWIEHRLSQEWIIAELSGAFGFMAMTLAGIGLYGLLSYDVVSRTREIGIRMALGTERRDVIRAVASRGVALGLAGVVLGVACATLIRTLVTKFLYDVTPNDPLTVISVAVLLLVVSLLAAVIPSRRAASVDPVVALRTE
jgi:ABC-type antimicrobial peptide transport system permease subunit